MTWQCSWYIRFRSIEARHNGALLYIIFIKLIFVSCVSGLINFILYFNILDTIRVNLLFYSTCWLQSPWRNFSRCMGPVPTRHAQEFGKLQYVANKECNGCKIYSYWPHDPPLLCLMTYMDVRPAATIYIFALLHCHTMDVYFNWISGTRQNIYLSI